MMINLYRKIVYFIGSPSSCKSYFNIYLENGYQPPHATWASLPAWPESPLSYVPILTSPPPADLISHSDWKVPLDPGENRVPLPRILSS